MNTKLMTRLFSGNEPEFSQKVQEGIEEAREKGSAKLPEEQLEFSKGEDDSVEITDKSNGEVTIAMENPKDPTDEILVKGEVKSESDADATKAAEDEAKEQEKAELMQQVADNLGEIKKAVDDLKESNDVELAKEVKAATEMMSEDLDELEGKDIDVTEVRTELKSFSDAADEVIKSTEESPKEDPKESEEVIETKIEATCNDKKFSVTFKGASSAYVANFVKAFSEKIEELEVEETKKESEDQIKEEVATIQNNIQEIDKAVTDLKESGDKELAENIQKTLSEITEQIEEVKEKGADTEELEANVKTYSEEVTKVLEGEPKENKETEEPEKTEETKTESEGEKTEQEKSEEERLEDKKFSRLDSYLDMAPKSTPVADKTFSAKEVEESKQTLGGCLFHKF